MYSATIKNKVLVSGMLTVTVAFKDDAGGNEFTEDFQTNQKQTDEWIKMMVVRKLHHLNSLPNLHEKIEVGETFDGTEKLVESTDESDPARAEYAKKLKLFERFVSAVIRGFTSQEAEEYKVLKKYLTDNFKPEYLDLFNG